MSFVAVQLLSCLCNPKTTAVQASLSFAIFQSLPWVHCHVLWVDNAIQPSPAPLPPSTPVLNLSQHQDIFQWVSCLASGGQSIGDSTSASVLPMNIQGWFPLGLIGFIFLWSKGLSRVFSSTTIRKHQFFGVQPSLQSNSRVCTLPVENHSFTYTELCWQRFI